MEGRHLTKKIRAGEERGDSRRMRSVGCVPVEERYQKDVKNKAREVRDLLQRGFDIAFVGGECC